MSKSVRYLLFLSAILAGALSGQPLNTPAAPLTETPLSSRDSGSPLLSFSAGIGIDFLGFDRRDLWSEQLQFYGDEAKRRAENGADSAAILLLPFQKVDVMFPVELSVRVAPVRPLSFGGGVEWFRGSQEAFLLHAEGIEPLRYTLSSWSLFAEAAVVIPAEFLTISGGEGLRFSFRRYWLPAARITSEWQGEKREIWADPEPGGSGWGVSLGSRFFRYRSIRAAFEIEWKSIRARSDEQWSKLLPDLIDTGEVTWSLGAIGASVRLDWGVVNKQQPTQGEDYVPPISDTSVH